MRNLIYALGITSFMVCMVFTVAISFTNPFYGMSEAAVAQATTKTSTDTKGSSTSDEIAFTHRPNTHIYWVETLEEVTLGRVTRYPYNTYEAEVSANYSFLSAKASMNHNRGFTQISSSKTYNDPVVCNRGGGASCFKSPNGTTLFDVY